MQEGRGNPFFHFVEGGREKIREFLDGNAPPHSRGIIKALVLGERGDIDPETDEKFIVAGVNHILSISGLHVGFVAAFFSGATRWILKPFPSILLQLSLSKTSALVAVIPVIFYTFIAGLGVAMAWEDYFAKDGIWQKAPSFISWIICCGVRSLLLLSQ